MNIRIRSITYHIKVIETADEQAPYIVFLHGFMGSGRCFKRLLHNFRSEYNLATIDLLGHGKTQGPSTPDRYRTDEQLLDLEQILNKIGLSSTYFLYGYSMGGRLALRFALRYPESIRGLILESTHPGIRSSFDREKRLKKDHKWARWIEKDFTSFLSWWQQLNLFQIPDVENEIPPWYKEIQRKQNPRQMGLSLQGFGQGAVQPVHHRLNRLSPPVLLATGEHDTKYRNRMKKMKEKIPKAQLAIISDAAHRVHLDAHREWYRVVKNFILEH